MKLPTRRFLLQYIVLGVVQSATVYAVYSPYMFLWLNFTWAQYVKWLLGGLPYSLLTGWFFAFVVLRVKNKFFPEKKLPLALSGAVDEFVKELRKLELKEMVEDAGKISVVGTLASPDGMILPTIGTGCGRCPKCHDFGGAMGCDDYPAPKPIQLGKEEKGLLESELSFKKRLESEGEEKQ